MESNTSKVAVDVEILRGKGYPQTDEDPNPCTTQARVSIVTPDYLYVMAPEQCSSVQENSNAPFYKDKLSYLVESESFNEAILQIKIIEFTRKDEPFVILYGAFPITLSSTKGKTEVLVPLSDSNPMDHVSSEGAHVTFADEGQATGEKASLGLHLQISKVKEEIERNPDADVDIGKEHTKMRSTMPLVPAGGEYVWLRMISDKAWGNSFRGALAAAWRSVPPLGEPPKPPGTKTRGANSAKAGAAAPPPDAELRSIGEVAIKKWRCRRTHQVLTRVRLSAEKFIHKQESLLFTPDEEMEYRREKKTRAKMLETLCLEALEKTGSSNLRDWQERLWVLFTVGVNCDPASGKSLSYDTRKKVHESIFEDDDEVILQASLLNFFVPSIGFEECQSIAERDMQALTAEMENAPAAPTPQQWNASVTEHQKRFTITLVAFIGPLLETLTETELLKAFKYFKPSVHDAQQRILKGGKTGIKSRLARPDSAFYMKGSGIPIKHLDKLGHRKQANQFA